MSRDIVTSRGGAVAVAADAPFRRLEQALRRRRIARVDVRLRIEILMLVALVDGFLFWQARVPLDGLQRARGDQAVLLAIGAILLGLALAGGALAAARLARVLAERAPGPEWLALSVAGGAVVRHLARESKLHAAWVAAIAPAFVAAAWGLAPAIALAALALAFVTTLVVAAELGTRSAAWLAQRSRTGATPRSAGGALDRSADTHTDPWLAKLAAVARSPRRRHVGSGRWVRLPPPLAMAAKDLLLTARPTPARARAIAAVALGALSAAAWLLAGPGTPAEAGEWTRLVAFGLGLVAAASLAEWSATLAGLDPFPVLKPLPLGARAIWTARTIEVAAFVVALAAAHAIAARSLAPAALEVHLAWLGGAAFLIGLLGVHYGITLHPNADAARRLLGLTLAIAMASSLMIPLLGWVLLLAAVIHSGRRVRRWNVHEPEAS